MMSKPRTLTVIGPFELDKEAGCNESSKHLKTNAIYVLIIFNLNKLIYEQEGLII